MKDRFLDEIFYEEKNSHRYISYELKYPTEKEEFLKYILPILQEEYGFGFNLEDKLENLDEKRTKTIKQFLAKANAPNPDKKFPADRPWLKNTRSKISELLGKELLKQLESVYFTCRLSLEEEDPDMPKRGIDNFGFIFEENDGGIELTNIVTSEVKASESKDSPPSVVHSSSDSMFKSLKVISEIDERLKKAIAKSIDKLPKGEFLELICDVAENIENNNDLEELKKKITVLPFLFRKKEFYSDSDFGKFKTHSDEFDLATIKYYIVVVDYELNEFADEIYSALREG